MSSPPNNPANSSGAAANASSGTTNPSGLPANTTSSGTPSSVVPNTSTTAPTPLTTVPSHASVRSPITGSHFGITPSGIRLTLVTLNNADWPKDLILDLGKANWVQWSLQLSLVALCHGLDPWLDGSLTCPDEMTAPEANFIWKRNDSALRGFMQTRILSADVHLVQGVPTARLMLDKLRLVHEKQGPFAQLNLLLKGLQTDFTYDTSLRDTLSELRTYYQRIVAMGSLRDDDIFSVLILNALSKHFGPLQYSINSLSNTPHFNSEMIANRILDEDAMIRRRVESGQPANPYAIATSQSSAFPAVSSRPRAPRPICANCKKETHSADYCIAPGGKMAGRTIDEARTAFRAAQNKTNQPRDSRNNGLPRAQNQTALVAASTPTAPSMASPVITTASPVFVNGLPYVLDPSWTASTNTPSSAHIAEVDDTPETIVYPYHAFLAYNTSPFPSTVLSASSLPTVSSRTSLLPFIIDTGATCHISPILSDFKFIRAIKPHPIKGLGDHSVNAIGMGVIELQTPSGQLTLKDALYVPNASVRLISVFLLGDAHYSTHFYPRGGHCYISDYNNTIVARGKVLSNRKLFALSEFTVLLPKPSSPSFAHYASRSPDVDTWHKRLGHCGPRTIIDMARSNVVEGMPVDISSPPPKCEHCILGKQTRSSVPKQREGARATKPLERIYVDLCGPMTIPSRSNRLYSMNIIDDYSSFVWSLPLRSKDEAAPVLKSWLL